MIDITTLQQLITQASWALPLVTGIVAVIRQTGIVGDRWLPAVSTIAGIAVGILIIQVSITGAVVGLILGLGATGLWEFGKTTVANARAVKND